MMEHFFLLAGLSGGVWVLYSTTTETRKMLLAAANDESHVPEGHSHYLTLLLINN